MEGTLEFLANVDLFKGVKADALAALARQLYSITVRGGEIFQEGETADGLYVIRAGAAKVTKSAAGAQGVEAVLGILLQGDSFGEIGLIDGLPRSASVSAMGEMECYFLPRAAFLEALEGNPEIAVGMLPALASMVRNADQWVAQSI